MVKGVGIDMVDIDRIDEAMKIPNFITSTFTENEIRNEHGDKREYYAARFACKEAVFKALHMEMDWRKIEILNNGDGSPYVVNKYGVGNIWISITTGCGYATALCIIE
jgi:holo-[acyl-carrier protein] synthase